MLVVEQTEKQMMQHIFFVESIDYDLSDAQVEFLQFMFMIVLTPLNTRSRSVGQHILWPSD